MKRMFALSLCLLALWLSPALADDYDSAIDAMFDSGKVVFRQVPFRMPDPEACEIVLPPAEYWDFVGYDEMSEGQLRGALETAQYMIASYAPDGESGLGMLGVGNAILPVAVSANRVAVICPTEGRGVYGEEGALGKVFGHLYLKPNPKQYFGMGDEGVIWSPSGRYFCIINNTALLQQMQTVYGSPILVDTQTGEMFSIDSFSHKLTSPDGGWWLAGCFSGDEQYFYALVCSNRYSKRYTLVRYDIETCETTPCGEGFDSNGLPTISLLQNGNILVLVDAYKAEQTQALSVISPEGTTETTPLSFNTETWKFMPRRLNYSAKSGWGLLRGWLYGKPALQLNTDKPVFGYALQRMRLDSNGGTDTVWMISAEAQIAVEYGVDQIQEVIATARDVYEFIQQHMLIADVKLSPDGRYAAVLVVKRDNLQNLINSKVLIIRLEDMKTLPAEGIDIDENTAENLTLFVDQSIARLNWSQAGLLCLWNGLWQLGE